MRRNASIFGYECIRAFRSPAFWIAVLAGVTVGLPVWFRQVYSLLTFEQIIGRDVYYPSNSVYYVWLGAAGSTSQIIFLHLIPILAATPFAVSWRLDMEGGLSNQLILQSGRKKYLQAKFLAVFVSGGAAVALPYLFQFMLTAMIAPMTRPDPYSIYGLFYTQQLVEFYYAHPLIYTLFFIFVSFLYGGAFASFALMISHLTDLLVTIWLAPFLLLMGVWYLINLTGFDGKFLPVLQIICGQESLFEWQVTAFEVLVITIPCYLIHMNLGKKKELI